MEPECPYTVTHENIWFGVKSLDHVLKMPEIPEKPDVKALLVSFTSAKSTSQGDAATLSADIAALQNVCDSLKSIGDSAAEYEKRIAAKKAELDKINTATDDKKSLLTQAQLKSAIQKANCDLTTKASYREAYKNGSAEKLKEHLQICDTILEKVALYKDALREHAKKVDDAHLQKHTD